MYRFPNTRLRQAGLLLLILLFMLAGLDHFRHPNFYVSIIPPYLPFHYELSYISAYFEIAGAIGLLFAQTRKVAGYGLLLLLIAIFPANLHMAMNSEYFPEYTPITLYLRLPMQLLFIIWVYWATIRVKAIGT